VGVSKTHSKFAELEARFLAKTPKKNNNIGQKRVRQDVWFDNILFFLLQIVRFVSTKVEYTE